MRNLGLRQAYRQFCQTLGLSRRDRFSASAIVETLESRTLFSLVPTTVDPTAVGNLWDDVSAVSAANGQYMVASATQNGDYDGFYYNLFDTQGKLLTIGDETDWTGRIEVSNDGFTDADIALNNFGVGAVAWTDNTTIHIQRLNLADGTHLGEELTLAIPADGGALYIDKIRIAVDASGDLLLAWQSDDFLEIQLDDSPDPYQVNLSSLGFAQYDTASQTWSAPVTVVASSLSGQTATTVDAFDLALQDDGAFVLAWNQSALNVATNADGDLVTTTLSSSVQFKRFDSAGAAIGSAVSVSSIANPATSKNFQVQLALDSSGTFTVAHGYQKSVSADDSFDLGETHAFRRTYDKNGVALSSDTSIVDVFGHAGFAVTYDSRHQLVTTWWSTEDMFDWNGKLYVELANTNGTRIISYENLSLAYNDDESTNNVSNIVTVADAHGLRIVYGVDGYDESILSKYYDQNSADLSLSLGTSTLPRFVSSGETVTGTLNVTLSNMGSVAAKGTVTFSIVLSSFSTPEEGDPVIFTFDQAVDLAPGSSKSFTLKNIQLTSAMFTDFGDFSLFVSIVSKDSTGVSNDPNAANDKASTEVTYIDSNAVKNLAISSVQAQSRYTTLVPGDRLSVAVRLQNNGDINYRNEKVAVTLRVVSATNENAWFDVAVSRIKLNLKAGASATVRIPVTLTSELQAGNYNFVALLGATELDTDSYSDDYFGDDIRNSVSGFDLAWEFGNIAGRSGNTRLTLTNLDGTLVTYTLAGKGYGSVELPFDDGTEYTDENGDPVTTPVDISLYGTTASTAVVVTTGSKSVANILSVTATSALGSFAAARGMLYGGLDFASIKTLVLADLVASDTGHTLTFGGPATQQTTMVVGRVEGATITSTAAIRTLSATELNEVNITAPTVGTLRTTGNKKLGITGDFTGSLKLSGTDKNHDDIADYNLYALNAVSVVGAFSGSVNAAGRIGNIAVGREIAGSIYSTGSITGVSAAYTSGLSVFAGVLADEEGNGLVPDTIDGFVHEANGSLRNASIGSVTFTNRLATLPGDEPYIPTSSSVTLAASYIGSVKLGLIDFTAVDHAFVLPEAAIARGKIFGAITFRYEDSETGKFIGKGLTSASAQELLDEIGVRLIPRN